MIHRADRDQLCGLLVNEKERRFSGVRRWWPSGSRTGALAMRTAPSRRRVSDEPEASGRYGDRPSPDSDDSCFGMCRRISRRSSPSASISARTPHSADRSQLASAAYSRLPRREPVPAGPHPARFAISRAT